jgi:phosphatidylglycerophosphate synthase
MKKPTTPDWFSLYRFIAAPLIIYTLIKRRKTKFLILCAINLFTDAIDGFLARRLNEKTKRGAKLDSGGDLLTQLLMMIGLFRLKKAFLQKQKFSLLLIAGVYALQMTVSYLKYKKLTTFHTYSSKLAFTVLGVFYLLLFFYKYISWLFRTAVTLTIISLIEDILLVLLLPKPKDNVKGLYWELKQ